MPRGKSILFRINILWVFSSLPFSLICSAQENVQLSRYEEGDFLCFIFFFSEVTAFSRTQLIGGVDDAFFLDSGYWMVAEILFLFLLP